MTAKEIIAKLELQPHPVEGGFFRETYRSKATLPHSVIPENGGDRSIGTAIYYLLTPETVSEMHRLPTDEIFHFYLGDPVEMLQLMPNGTSKRIILGNQVLEGQHPQTVVLGGIWQGRSLISGGQFALLGATMAPGFDYTDYQTGNRKLLSEKYPSETNLIKKLTPGQDG